MANSSYQLAKKYQMELLLTQQVKYDEQHEKY
jgi:hypothetical protein